MDYGTMCSHYLEKEDTPTMWYLQHDFFGIPMKSELKPFLKTVNNGYTIMAQDKSLIRDLEFNEKYHNGIIDWYLFREGKTILFDTCGRVFGCTNFIYNSLVEVVEFVNTDFLEKEY